MADHASTPQLSIDAYVDGERVSPIKRKYAAGQVSAMAGASERHYRVALNVRRRPTPQVVKPPPAL